MAPGGDTIKEGAGLDSFSLCLDLTRGLAYAQWYHCIRFAGADSVTMVGVVASPPKSRRQSPFYAAYMIEPWQLSAPPVGVGYLADGMSR